MKILEKEMNLKGYTGKELAMKLMKHPSNITGWLSGKYRPNPSSIMKMKELGFSDTACLEPSKEVEV